MGILCHALPQREAGAVRPPRCADQKPRDGAVFCPLGRKGKRSCFRRILPGREPRRSSLAGLHSRAGISGEEGATLKTAAALGCFCDQPDPVPAFQYDRPPEGETRFDWKGQTYRRGYRRCENCGHWTAEIEMDLTDFYRGGYVDGTYGERMKETFLKILALPAEKSDNQARVQRVLEFANKHLQKNKTPSLLDVGSGLAVFPFQMKEAGWCVTALDPDARAAIHAREMAGVRAIHGDFLTWEPESEERFDLITLNKVLEHVKDPIAMLRMARRCINPDGLLYVEVPDVSAAKIGPTREEFFIEHLQVFSLQSLIDALRKSGWEEQGIYPLMEPSGKFTLASFSILKKI